MAASEGGRASIAGTGAAFALTIGNAGDARMPMANPETIRTSGGGPRPMRAQPPP
jgi:hypothetical protein